MANKPKKVKSKVQQSFIDIVKDEKIGNFLFKFYRYYLDFGGAPTLYEKQKLKVLNLNDRRLKHLKTIVEKYDIEHIIHSAGVIMDKIDGGLIATNAVRPGYYDKVLQNKPFQNKEDTGFSYD